MEVFPYMGKYKAILVRGAKDCAAVHQLLEIEHEPDHDCAGASGIITVPGRYMPHRSIVHPDKQGRKKICTPYGNYLMVFQNVLFSLSPHYFSLLFKEI